MPASVVTDGMVGSEVAGGDAQARNNTASASQSREEDAVVFA